MRQSQLFTKITKEGPKDEISVNARLLERGGFIKKFMAGVYIYLPLGFKVLDKINSIIREEMNAIGAQEVYLSVLQPKDLWEKTGRWKNLKEVMYQFKDHSGRSIGLGVTHEEAVTWLAKSFIHSYRDLPKAIYQIQAKFRDELRPKSGLIRTREFLMKDLYSFHESASDLDKYYQRVAKAYSKIFNRCGLKTLIIEASGGDFTKEYSHEFQVISRYGEDTIVYCSKHNWAQNKEISKFKAGNKCPLGTDKLVEAKGVEVGNIFRLGTRFSKDLNLMYKDKNGQNNFIWMASYGIGPGRVMGTVVDAHHDDKGIIWPKSIAPFKVHLLWLAGNVISQTNRIKKSAEKIYKTLSKNDIEILYDDRDDLSVGEKFAEADLLGIPFRVVISTKTLTKGFDILELKNRNENKVRYIKLSKLISLIKDAK